MGAADGRGHVCAQSRTGAEGRLAQVASSIRKRAPEGVLLLLLRHVLVDLLVARRRPLLRPKEATKLSRIDAQEGVAEVRVREELQRSAIPPPHEVRVVFDLLQLLDVLNEAAGEAVGRRVQETLVVDDWVLLRVGLAEEHGDVVLVLLRTTDEFLVPSNTTNEQLALSRQEFPPSPNCP